MLDPSFHVDDASFVEPVVLEQSPLDFGREESRLEQCVHVVDSLQQPFDLGVFLVLPLAVLDQVLGVHEPQASDPFELQQGSR